MGMGAKVASVLVVEDEPVLGQAFVECLHEEGYDAHWEGSAEGAVEWLRERSADLALIDYRLPGMDGIELVRVIRNSHPQLKLVVMTAHGDEWTADQAREAGAAEFIRKPVDLDRVTELALRLV